MMAAAQALHYEWLFLRHLARGFWARFRSHYKSGGLSLGFNNLINMRGMVCKKVGGVINIILF